MGRAQKQREEGCWPVMRAGAGVQERDEDRGASESGGQDPSMFLMTVERLQCLTLPFPSMQTARSCGLLYYGIAIAPVPSCFLILGSLKCGPYK